ncbi:MAG TPA: hypothetical protein VLV50_20660 [Stellaceae bacterium]|nr:hypothetical protein [Stellaceae bacterium]
MQFRTVVTASVAWLMAILVVNETMLQLRLVTEVESALLLSLVFVLPTYAQTDERAAWAGVTPLAQGASGSAA